MSKVKWTRALGALLCACTGLTASAAQASGFEAARFGSEHGNAAGATPFALYYNPAALTTTERVHIAGNFTLALRDATFTRAASDTAEPADASGANTGKATLFNALSAPALAASMRFGDWAVGLGVFVPFGGQVSWDANGARAPGYPGTSDGPARWWLVEGQTSVIYASAGAAYRIRPLRLSVGAAASFTHTGVNLTRALTSNVRFDDAVASEGRAHIDVGGSSGSFGLGVLWEAIQNKLWAGLSYQAPPGLYKEQTLKGDMRVAFSGSPTTNPVGFHMALPDIIRFGVRARPRPEYELRFNGELVRWSVHERQCVSLEGTACRVTADGVDPTLVGSAGNVQANQIRDWKNAFGLKIGGSYYFPYGLEGFAGLGYDSGAVRMRTLEPSVVDGASLSGVLGGRVRIADVVSILASYQHQGFFARDSTGKSRLDTYAYPTHLPDAGGKYTLWMGTFNLMAEVHLK